MTRNSTRSSSTAHTRHTAIACSTSAPDFAAHQKQSPRVSSRASLFLLEQANASMEEDAGAAIRRTDRAAEGRKQITAHAEFVLGKIGNHGLAFRQIGSINENLQRACDRIEPNDIAVLDARDRTAI